MNESNVGSSRRSDTVDNDQAESLIQDDPGDDSDIDSEIEGLNTFRLFVQLPTEDLTTFTNLPSGTTVFDLKAKIELVSGIPGQIYTLNYMDGVDLDEESRLVLGKNIHNADTLRVQLLLSWNELFYSTWKNNLDEVYYNGGVQLLNHACFNVHDAPSLQRVIAERAFVALYISCHRGHFKLTQALLGIGADYTGRTSYGRTPLHAAASQGHLDIIELLIKHGSDVRDRDYEGKSALEIASEFNKTECSRQLWLRQWNLRARRHSDTPREMTSPRVEQNDMSSVRSLRMSFRNTPRQAYFLYKKNEPQTQRVELNGKRCGQVTRSECTTVSGKLLHVVELNDSIPLPPCNSPRLLTSARGRNSIQARSSMDYPIRENSLTAKILELHLKKERDSELSTLLYRDPGDNGSGERKESKLPKVEQAHLVAQKRRVSLQDSLQGGNANGKEHDGADDVQSNGAAKTTAEEKELDATTEENEPEAITDVNETTTEEIGTAANGRRHSDKEIHVKFAENEDPSEDDELQEGNVENDYPEETENDPTTETAEDGTPEPQEQEEYEQEQENSNLNVHEVFTNQESDYESEGEDEYTSNSEEEDEVPEVPPRKTKPSSKPRHPRARSAPLPSFNYRYDSRPVSATTTRSLPTLLYRRAKSALPRVKTWNIWLDLKQQQISSGEVDRAEIRKQRNLKAYEAWMAKKREEAAKKGTNGSDDKDGYRTDEREVDPHAFRKWLKEKERRGEIGVGADTSTEFRVSDTVQHIYGTITFEQWLKEKQKQRRRESEGESVSNEVSGGKGQEETKKRLVQSAKSHQEWLADKHYSAKIEQQRQIANSSELGKGDAAQENAFQQWLAKKAEAERAARHAANGRTRSAYVSRPRDGDIGDESYRDWYEKKAEEIARKKLARAQAQRNELEKRKQRERRRQNLVYQSFSNWLTNKLQQDLKKEKELLKQLQRSRKAQVKSR